MKYLVILLFCWVIYMTEQNGDLNPQKDIY
jgi:hypothetical protein